MPDQWPGGFTVSPPIRRVAGPSDPRRMRTCRCQCAPPTVETVTVSGVTEKGRAGPAAGALTTTASSDPPPLRGMAAPAGGGGGRGGRAGQAPRTAPASSPPRPVVDDAGRHARDKRRAWHCSDSAGAEVTPPLRAHGVAPPAARPRGSYNYNVMATKHVLSRGDDYFLIDELLSDDERLIRGEQLIDEEVIDELLSDDERLIRGTVRRFVDRE